VIGLPALYALGDAIFTAFAIVNLGERRFGNAAFWALLATSFLLGDRLGDLTNGGLALAMVGLAGSGALKRTPAAKQSAPEHHPSWKLFAPALIIPAVTLAGTLALKHATLAGVPLIDPKQVTLVALGLAVVVALGAAMLWLRPPLTAPAIEGARIMDQVGWAAVLPQMLAALGAVFALAGVGDTVGHALGPLIPEGSRLIGVIVYASGMALLTMALGNAFAAFPVMMAAIGIPVLIHGQHGNPAVVGAVGMLCGFCGTLLTPMAANFNLVPAALLGLTDHYGVIRAQAGTALPLLGVNTAILYWGAFR